MKKRPMKELFDSLTELGAVFEYLGVEGFLPVKVTGRASKNRALVHVDISKSTQFLSALMMISCMIEGGLDIEITSEKTIGAYVKITMQMMKEFGCEAIYDGHDYHIAGKQAYRSGEYDIEPDISAACYFWAAAALTGGNIRVNKVKRSMMQGDIKFLDVLTSMGCTVLEDSEGVTVIGPKDGKLLAVNVDMNDFSDKTMTLAAIAPFACGTTHIRNVGHIRLQESDRIAGILENLESLGVHAGCEKNVINGKTIEGIYINGTADDENKPHGAIIKTFDDHRMAMSFAVSGLACEGVVIQDPMCCRKTFENFFEVFSHLQK